MIAGISGRTSAGLAAAGLVLALAGCQNGMTYGTGVSPGMQTLNDVAGIAEINSKNEPIDYAPRAPIVEPPVATLPPPGQANANLAANWPDDPDEKAKQLKAQSTARNRDESEPFGSKDPVFRLPQQQQASNQPSPTLERNQMSDYERAHSTPEQVAQSKKLYAEAKNVPLDEDGNPVRRYLTEPPSAYRAPDAEAPLEVSETTKKKRGWKWPDLWPFDN